MLIVFGRDILSYRWGELDGVGSSEGQEQDIAGSVSFSIGILHFTHEAMTASRLKCCVSKGSRFDSGGKGR